MSWPSYRRSSTHNALPKSGGHILRQGESNCGQHHRHGENKTTEIHADVPKTTMALAVF